MIIAIDGPAGSGKSTMARIIAKKLQYSYIETGSMYRAVAWQARQSGVDLNDLEAVTAIAEKLRLEFVPGPDGQVVFVEGEDRTSALRTETIGSAAAMVAANPGVRDIMTAKQREMGEAGNVVMDGRDIGTVVFPNAEKKFYLIADPEERAQRRYQEMKENNLDPKLENIVQQVKQRDYEDKNRAVSPLKPAEDAIELDTTNKGIDEVTEIMVRLIQPPENL